MEDSDRESSVASSEQEHEELDISHPEVVTKYKTAADIANRALKMVMDACVAGASIRDLCTRGDEFIETECQKVYHKAGAGAAEEGDQILKGIAFPTCISVNNCVCHFSPVDPDDQALAAGDMVKIDLGCHIDGFIATAAHTVVLGECTGRKADVLLATYKAAECAMKMMKPGVKNYEVSMAIAKIAAAYHVTPVEGVLSHHMKQYIIDGNQVIMNRPTLECHCDQFEVGVNEVYCLDIVMSTGEGHPREQAARTNVFKRAIDQNYSLKMKTSRDVFNEINRRFPSTPFNVRSLKSRVPRMGVSEMMGHNMLTALPVLYERDGDFVAQFKMTVLVMPSATHKITTPTLALPAAVTSEFTITDPEVIKALAASMKKKKNKKKAAAPAAGEKKEEKDDE